MTLDSPTAKRTKLSEAQTASTTGRRTRCVLGARQSPGSQLRSPFGRGSRLHARTFPPAVSSNTGSSLHAKNAVETNVTLPNCEPCLPMATGGTSDGMDHIANNGIELGTAPGAEADADLAAARAAWAQLREVDNLTVTVVVDNETDGLSTPCACCDPYLDPATRMPYQSEFSAAVQKVTTGQWPAMDFSQSLLAGHGLSLLLTATTAGGQQRRVLFDGGPRGDMWASNAARLGLDMAGVGAAVLSHWHADHSGGLVAVAQAASAARGGDPSRQQQSAVLAALGSIQPGKKPRQEGASESLGADAGAATAAAEAAEGEARAPGPEPFVFDVHADRPMRRGLLIAGKPVPFNEDPTIEELSLPGCRVAPRVDPHTLLDDCFFVSGAIPRVTSFEPGQPGHATQGADGVWQPDPLIMDERYMAVRVRGQGAVVISGCSHAGIINVVTHVKAVCQGPVFVVMGGLHLAGRFMEGRIPSTVEALRGLDPGLVVGGHCTGWRAKAALTAAFPGRFQPCSVGGTYSFLAPLEQKGEGEDAAAAAAAEPEGLQV